jgi:hypothetical protein
MDGLSAAASVISVLQLSDRVITVCWEYCKTAKHAKKDILEVRTAVKDLKNVLDDIQMLIENDGDVEDRRPVLNTLTATFKSCETALQEIAKELGMTFDADVNTENAKVGFRKKASWPWKEKGVSKILQTIEKYKTTFILAINGDTLQLLRAVQECVHNVSGSVRDISESVQTMTISTRHEKIIKWLKNSIDPSLNHNSARKKHEPTTGDWLLESELFATWKTMKNGSLWLYGMPGAGKTILCSTIIDQVKSLCAGDAAYRYAYFYFDFNDAQKQTVAGMLSSLIAQLSVPELPKEVDELYKQCNHGEQQPGEKNLVTTLIALLGSGSHQTYLIMDALDECSEKEGLFKTIRRVIQTSAQVNVLVTSREDHDITEGLRAVIVNSISLECGGLGADIERHIHSCLENDSEWRNCGPIIKQEIQAALVKGARGM